MISRIGANLPAFGRMVEFLDKEATNRKIVINTDKIVSFDDLYKDEPQTKLILDNGKEKMVKYNYNDVKGKLDAKA